MSKRIEGSAMAGYQRTELMGADKASAEQLAAGKGASPTTSDKTSSHKTPKDSARQADSKGAATLKSASGRATGGGLSTPSQLSADERQWAGKLAKASGSQVGRLFHQSYDAVNDSFAGVLGKLSAKGAKAMFPSEGRRKLLAKACVHAFINRVASGIDGAFAAAEKRLHGLVGSASDRAALWSKAKTPAQRTKLLVGLGVKPERAKSLAASTQVPDGELVAALRDTQKRVTAERKHMGYRLRQAVKTPSDALALLETFKGQANGARKLIGVRKGSFADKALAAHTAAGKRDQKLFAAYQFGFGILAGLVSGGIITTGVFGAGVVAAGTSAVMGAPGLVAQSGKRAAAQLAEALKIADKGAHAKAKQAFSKALSGYLAGIVVGGASGAAGKVLGDAAAKVAANRVLTKLTTVGIKKTLLKALERTGVSREFAKQAVEEIAFRFANKTVSVGIDVFAAYVTEVVSGLMAGKQGARS